MDSGNWKKRLSQTFGSIGFFPKGKLFIKPGKDVSVLLSLQSSDFDTQWFINVGFWISALGSELPHRLELSHIYLRLERLFPGYREEILKGGALDEPELPQALEILETLLGGIIGEGLHEMTSMDEIRRIFASGELRHGLTRIEARELLKNESV